MKKILIVLYYYHPYVSGLSALAKNVAETLNQSKFQVTVLTSRFNSSLPKNETINGVRVIRTPILFKMSKGIISPLFWLKTIILSRHHDIVNFHLPNADAGLAAIFIPKKKIVTQYHCDLKLSQGFTDRLISKISYLLMDITLFKSKRIIVTTKDYFAHSKFNKYLSKSVQIYPPVNTDLFSNKPYRILMNRLSLSKDTFKIGFVGRIVKEKGIEYLLNSVRYLQHEIDDFKVIIAGDYKQIAGGSVKSSLDKYEKKYSNRILFTGFLAEEELISFYNMVDVIVLPSIDPLESFGLVQVEAMLCGTPVIASDLPGVREVIKRTGNGLLSKPRNAKDIAEKIISIYKKPIKITDSSLTVFKFDKTIDKYQTLFDYE